MTYQEVMDAKPDPAKLSVEGSAESMFSFLLEDVADVLTQIANELMDASKNLTKAIQDEKYDTFEALITAEFEPAAIKIDDINNRISNVVESAVKSMEEA